MVNPTIIDTNDLLLTLIAALGPRARHDATLGELKWGGSTPLEVEQSTLEFCDEAGQVISHKEQAFGLTPGTQLIAPYSRSLIDESVRPPKGVLQRWRLNDWVVESPSIVPATEWGQLYVTWLPLQLPLAQDMHVVVGLVNLDVKPLDIARGMSEAVCWVDGVPWPSGVGRVWNTRYLIETNHSTRRHFRLADFPGLSILGKHEMALEMLGYRSKLQVVEWHDPKK